MSVRVRKKDGILIENDALSFLADSRTATADTNIISHAHLDHAHTGEAENVFASELTARLVEERTGTPIQPRSSESVELVPSGHILGSTAAVIRGEKDILYTGDFSLRDRQYLEGFQPPEADILIIESTYGIPNYRFPEQHELEKEIVDWLNDNNETPLFLFGYSLGKAQKIQSIVQENTSREIVAHGAVKKMNEAIEKNTELKFRAKPYGKNKNKLEEGNKVFVGPPSFSKTNALEKLVEKSGGLKAGFSGWSVDDSFRFRGDYDKGFAMSDHADFDELVETVLEVDPEKVYTTHGFDEAFASFLRREHGFNATALKKNQSTLQEFG